ncbi:MAG TPA: MBL fold metallo-hydrolase, partial [Candidatus Binatia bacterium]|nr:MBL fold metallo-hydrolase [Candidatus Binatia bacterium]
MTSVSFLGAAGTVTGSRFLLEADGRRVLIDCGLFQGKSELRQKNWAPMGVDPKALDAIILTHAHIDHTGYLPRLA